MVVVEERSLVYIEGSVKVLCILQNVVFCNFGLFGLYSQFSVYCNVISLLQQQKKVYVEIELRRFFVLKGTILIK